MLDNYFLWIGIGLILMVTVFRSQFKGQIGEIAVAYILRDLDKEKYKIFHDIKIKNNSQNTKTTQIDHLIISNFGIFCIETKAYKGKIVGKDFSRQWIQILPKQKNYFMNPILQNFAHIKSVEAILKDFYPDMKYFSIIGFSAEANIKDIDVKNAKVCIASNLPDVIKDLSTDEIITKEEVEKIVKIINDHKSLQSDFSHTRDIKKIKKENDKKIKQNICPKCGSTLIEKEGKYGKFIGCSNFPKCRFTISNKEMQNYKIEK